MGVLNLTPDSFSDGGRYRCVDEAVSTALEMIDQGAQIIDLGGESTRPGADRISIDLELERVMPVLQALRAETQVCLSVDTSKPEVMSAAIASGVDVINDVNALDAPGALACVRQSHVGLCLMHKKGTPASMQDNPCYDNVLQEVLHYLQGRLEVVKQAGVSADRVWLDPGFGFGKTLSDNLILMKYIGEFCLLGCPVLVGVSRKSMIGQILECPVDQRLAGGLALAAYSVMKGAKIIRTHDVKPTVEVLQVLEAVSGADHASTSI